MADYKLIGKNYTTPDLVAKVTGKATQEGRDAYREKRRPNFAKFPKRP